MAAAKKEGQKAKMQLFQALSHCSLEVDSSTHLTPRFHTPEAYALTTELQNFQDVTIVQVQAHILQAQRKVTRTWTQAIRVRAVQAVMS